MEEKIHFVNLIIEELFRANQLDDFVVRITNAKSNIACMDIVYPFVEEKANSLCQILEFPKKSEVKSEELRKQGNILYIQKDFQGAFHKFSKSICYAENGSIQLGLGYSNRSAVLFENQFYNECVKDIDLALINNYPDHMKEKLLKRKEKALNFLKGNISTSHTKYHTPIPNIADTNVNNLIQSACNNIKFDVDETTLRLRFIATKDIDVGKVILVEKPYSQFLVSDFLTLHCSYCTEMCYNLIPCQNCPREMYCNEQCRDEAHQKYHKYECRFVDTALTLCIQEFEIKNLRAIFTGRDEIKNESLDDLVYCQMTPSQIASNQYRSDRFLEIKNSLNDIPKMRMKDKHKFAIRAALLYYFTKHYSEFFNEFEPQYNMEDKFKHLILPLVMLAGENTSSIRKANSDDTIRVSHGLFPCFSIFTHACVSNVMVLWYGSYIVIRASRFIKKGEECNIIQSDNANGLLTYLSVPKSQRQSILQLYYNITCKCKACVNDWPIGWMLRDVPHCECTGVDKSLLLYNLPEDTEEVHSFIKKLKKAIKKSQRFEPNKTLEICVSKLYASYLKLGNRYYTYF